MQFESVYLKNVRNYNSKVKNHDGGYYVKDSTLLRTRTAAKNSLRLF